MTIRTLPATEVKNRFGSVLREIAKSGGPLVIERGNRAVAVIMSMSEYEHSQRHPTGPAGEQDLLQNAFGMWSNRADVDDQWVAQGRARWTSQWQDEQQD